MPYVMDDSPARFVMDDAPPSGGVLDFIKSDLRVIPERLSNLAAGAVRGAGSIGATLLYPVDTITDAVKGDRQQGLSDLVTNKAKPLTRNQERRAAMDSALQSMGADPSSLPYGAGKLGAEIAGAAGIGNALALPVRALSSAPLASAIASGLESGGFAVNGMGGVPGILTRAGTGAVTNGAMAGAIDPQYAGTGALIGSILPPAVMGAGKLGNALSSGMEGGAERLMQSALKPTIKQLQTGDAAIATRTLLDRGINPNAAGVEKLRALIDDVDTQITGAISGSNATIDKQAVLNRLNGTARQFRNQVSPTADLRAIQGVADDFMAHPQFPLPQTSIPVQAAQDLKRGTYGVLAKKYGQMGGAETEAQKALARGLKEEIATAVPGIGALNAEQSKLLTTLNVAERRALMEMNKNPGGLALLASNPVSFAAFMADKSALFKSLAARMLNGAAQAPGSSFGLLGQAASNPLLRGGFVATEASP
jgi:hypothetical protein